MSGALQTVTISTDGRYDYVTLPDGQKLILGIVSVAKMVGACAPGRSVARRALDEFIEHGEAMLPIDMDAFEALVTPKRVRWASFASPSIPYPDRTPLTEMHMPDMKNLARQINLVKYHTGQIVKQASDGKPVPVAAIEALQTMVAAIHLPDFGDQSKNDAFTGLGAPKVDTTDGTSMAPDSVTNPKVACADHLEAHAQMAESVLSTVEATGERVDALVAEGKMFNAAKARLDLHKVASGVDYLLSNVDMAQPWVKDDLQKLASEATRIHGLFFPKKLGGRRSCP